MFNPVFNREFGELVLRTREHNGMNQATLAKKLGLTAQFLGRVEQGRVPMPKLRMGKAIKILKIKKTDVLLAASGCAQRYCHDLLG